MKVQCFEDLLESEKFPKHLRSRVKKIFTSTGVVYMKSNHKFLVTSYGHEVLIINTQ